MWFKKIIPFDLSLNFSLSFVTEENTTVETAAPEKKEPQKNQSSESASEKTPVSPSESGRNAPRGRGRGDKSRSKGRRGRGRRGNMPEKKEFDEEVLEIARVTRVVKGGRRLRFRATVVIGDRKGRVGLGTGKSIEVSEAIKKAVSVAKKNLIKVPMVDGTIPHELTFKHKSARILCMPAKDGTGIIAGGSMRKIFDLSGIQNVLGKSYGTNSKLVNAQATIMALQSFRSEKIGGDDSEKSKEEKAVAEKK